MDETPEQLDTPAMRQYRQFKQQYADYLLLFRMGDFYEMFYEDAKTASRVLGLTLTSRSKGPTAVPLAGIPYHALDTYLSRLIKAGIRVAVCEQVEDPALAKGLVKRDVTRLVTPGTLTDETLLDQREGNYLAAVYCPTEGRGAGNEGRGAKGEGRNGEERNSEDRTAKSETAKSETASAASSIRNPQSAIRNPQFRRHRLGGAFQRRLLDHDRAGGTSDGRADPHPPCRGDISRGVGPGHAGLAGFA